VFTCALHYALSMAYIIPTCMCIMRIYTYNTYIDTYAHTHIYVYDFLEHLLSLILLIRARQIQSFTFHFFCFVNKKYEALLQFMLEREK